MTTVQGGCRGAEVGMCNWRCMYIWFEQTFAILQSTRPRVSVGAEALASAMLWVWTVARSMSFFGAFTTWDAARSPCCPVAPSAVHWHSSISAKLTRAVAKYFSLFWEGVNTGSTNEWPRVTRKIFLGIFTLKWCILVHTWLQIWLHTGSNFFRHYFGVGGWTRDITPNYGPDIDT